MIMLFLKTKKKKMWKMKFDCSFPELFVFFYILHLMNFFANDK